MATTTTRIKDIPTTATTAASDDYFVIDGATNGTRKYAHNSDAAAHLNIVRRTLAAGLTLAATDQPHQRIVPDADRNVTLPAETAGVQWRFLLCHAGAAYVITVKRAGGTTVGVLIPGGVVVCAWDGTAFGAC